MPRLKTKHLTRQERQDKAILDMQLFVEKLEKRYNISIIWNVDDILLVKK